MADLELNLDFSEPVAKPLKLKEARAAQRKARINSGSVHSDTPRTAAPSQPQPSKGPSVDSPRGLKRPRDEDPSPSLSPKKHPDGAPSTKKPRVDDRSAPQPDNTSADTNDMKQHSKGGSIPKTEPTHKAESTKQSSKNNSGTQKPDRQTPKQPRRLKHPMSLESISRGHQDYNEAVTGSLAERVQSDSASKLNPGTIQVEDVFEGDTFDSFDLHPWLLRALPEKLNVTRPTRIQAKSIPILKSGHDVFIKAVTGSGKTLAYLIPIINALAQEKFSRDSGTHALIIAPTRELVLQIYEVLANLARAFVWIVPGNVSGGEKKKSEKARLRKGVTVLVATPGRLLDHLNQTSSFVTKNLKWLVLDEADRLLDMGFEKEVRKIISLLNEQAAATFTLLDRRNVLVSATLTPEVNKLMVLSLSSPVHVEVKDDEFDPVLNPPAINDDAPTELPLVESKHLDSELQLSEHRLPKGLTQYYTIPEVKQRLVTLAAFLRDKTYGKTACKIIVFVQTTDSVDFLHALFSTIQFPTSPPTLLKKAVNIPFEPMLTVPLFKLHGSLTQLTRTATFNAFRKASSAILFCTDVAARGLHLPAVHWIIQYDAPSDPSAYVHRVHSLTISGGSSLPSLLPMNSLRHITLHTTLHTNRSSCPHLIFWQFEFTIQIGRTARLGTSGEALLFLMPSEKDYLSILTSQKMAFTEISEETILKTLKTNFEANPQRNPEVESKALNARFLYLVQNEADATLKSLGRAAFVSFVRAYATHTKATKHIFHIRNLHLGHVAKSFCLRETPSELGTLITTASSSASATAKNIGKGSKDTKSSKRGSKQVNNGPNLDRPRFKPLKSNFVQKSEFDSGL